MSETEKVEGLRLMAVHAHPDDESSKGAATMAGYAAQGVQVLVVTCTGGQRGDVLNPAMTMPAGRSGIDAGPDMGAVRRAELARACAVLGVDHLMLGFVDSGLRDEESLPDGCFARQRPDVVTGRLVRAMRAFRPHVVLTYDETGGYPHPDHVMCHRATVEAFSAAGDPTQFTEHASPWQPKKLYYHVGLHPARLEALAGAADRSAPRWARDVAALREHDPWPSLPITTRIRCGEHFETRERALLAHESQIDPDGFWFVFPAETQRAAWPTEDFHLARTLVRTDLVEQDLFAGITDAAVLRLVG